MIMTAYLKICVSSLFNIKNENAESFTELGRVTEHTCSYSTGHIGHIVCSHCVIYEAQKHINLHMKVHHE